MANEKNAEYLGDGVYAEHDGFQIALRANSHEAPVAIYLESGVLRALFDYAKRAGLLR